MEFDFGFGKNRERESCLNRTTETRPVIFLRGKNLFKYCSLEHSLHYTFKGILPHTDALNGIKHVHDAHFLGGWLAVR